jgi:hypothetical protein
MSVAALALGVGMVASAGAVVASKPIAPGTGAAPRVAPIAQQVDVTTNGVAFPDKLSEITAHFHKFFAPAGTSKSISSGSGDTSCPGTEPCDDK